MSELQDYVMTQRVEWRMESTDQVLQKLHQRVNINNDLAKLMSNRAWKAGPE